MNTNTIVCRFGCFGCCGPAFLVIGAQRTRCPVCHNKMFPQAAAVRREWAKQALRLSANRMGLMPQTRKMLRDKAAAI